MICGIEIYFRDESTGKHWNSIINLGLAHWILKPILSPEILCLVTSNNSFFVVEVCVGFMLIKDDMINGSDHKEGKIVLIFGLQT